MKKTLRIGTRGSALAMAQTAWVAEALEKAGHPTELVPVTTPGDQSSAPISEIGVGVFTSALREALIAGEVDVAVHSFKDLPTGCRWRPSRCGRTRGTRCAPGTV